MPQDQLAHSTPPQSRRPETGLPPDGPSPKPPALAWEERPAFREVFLIHFPPLAADAFREAGRHLYDAVLEHELREPEEPWVRARVRARVRALAEDLRFTAQVLSTLADARIAAGLTAEEMSLAMKAESWAGEVAAIALGIEGALEREARS